MRDSILDNKYQEDSAFRMIKAYEEIIADMKAQKKIVDPPIPDEKNTKPPVVAVPMPEIYKKYLDAIDWYVANVKADRVPDLKYAAAVIVLRYKDWAAARERLGAITEQYCGTKADVGFKAYDAILQTYFIDYNVEDEEQKDCALGKLLMVVDQFGESACGKAPEAKPYLARIGQIKSSVKTTIITKRLQLSMENEEKGTHKELIDVPVGAGRHRHRHRRRRTDDGGPGRQDRREAGDRAQQDLDRARRGAGARSHRHRQREPEGLGARRPPSTTPASSTRSSFSSARRRSATSVCTTTTPIRSGARKRSGTPRATTTASSSSTRRSRAT